MAAVVVLGLVLAACGGGGGTSAGDPAAPATSGRPAGEGVEMTTMAGPVVVVVRGERTAGGDGLSDAALLRLSTAASDRVERALGG